VQLIKTAIIKAGNCPAAFVAAAQCCIEASMPLLLCICSEVPQAGSPSRQIVLPAGLTPPQNVIDCLW
jgi:hypothetical protein